jgi:hypothetical protein
MFCLSSILLNINTTSSPFALLSFTKTDGVDDYVLLDKDATFVVESPTKYYTSWERDPKYFEASNAFDTRFTNLLVSMCIFEFLSISISIPAGET